MRQYIQLQMKVLFMHLYMRLQIKALIKTLYMRKYVQSCINAQIRALLCAQIYAVADKSPIYFRFSGDWSFLTLVLTIVHFRVIQCTSSWACITPGGPDSLSQEIVFKFYLFLHVSTTRNDWNCNITYFWFLWRWIMAFSWDLRQDISPVHLL